MKLTDKERELLRALGSIGGSTSAANMTKSARRKRAKAAAIKRWSNAKKKEEATQ